MATEQPKIFPVNSHTLHFRLSAKLAKTKEILGFDSGGQSMNWLQFTGMESIPSTFFTPDGAVHFLNFRSSTICIIKICVPTYPEAGISHVQCDTREVVWNLWSTWKIPTPYLSQVKKIVPNPIQGSWTPWSLWCIFQRISLTPTILIKIHKTTKWTFDNTVQYTSMLNLLYALHKTCMYL